jgi:hypothetical protein
MLWRHLLFDPAARSMNNVNLIKWTLVCVNLLWCPMLTEQRGDCQVRNHYVPHPCQHSFNEHWTGRTIGDRNMEPSILANNRRNHPLGSHLLEHRPSYMRTTRHVASKSYKTPKSIHQGWHWRTKAIPVYIILVTSGYIPAYQCQWSALTFPTCQHAVTT